MPHPEAPTLSRTHASALRRASISRPQHQMWIALLLTPLLLLAGCEADSYLDPSILGRWERTPAVLPILHQLDIIDEPKAEVEGLTHAQPEDLIATPQEYVIGPGDFITVLIYELLQSGIESAQNRRVDELGMIRLPVVGPVKAAGCSSSELEANLRDTLARKGVLRDAMVTVLVQDRRQAIFSVIGEPRSAGTAIGAYVIPQSDFRLLDAMALARGVSGGIKKLYIIRQAKNPDTYQASPPDSDELSSNPVDLIEDLLQQATDSSTTKPSSAPQFPDSSQPNSDASITDPAPGMWQWVNINDQWVRISRDDANPATTQAATSQPSNESDLPPVNQRIIEVPYDKLLDGDMRYNIVIRPGDVIRVPPPSIGNVYVGGAISRPGTYGLPGDRDLTLKQLIFAAGNVTSLAIPERVDLIRRVGNDQEATVRLNLRAIFEGVQPDIYLKPNDTINIGTSFAATPLAVVRNGFRMSYGFGFILDRNFGPDVFGPVPQDRN